MKIINIPKKSTLKDYNNAIDKQVEALSKVEGVLSIYQIGGLSTPGISDIDLVVVFKDGCHYDVNPKFNNDETGNYLFTHGLYGASEKQFQECLKFTFFHNFRLLYGKDFNLINVTDPSEQIILKKQIALEFLFKMYVNLVVQKSYNVIKLRALFLHIKALPYDFEFLDIHPKELIALVEKGISIRSNWLDGSVTKAEVKIWFKQFFSAYHVFLVSLFKDYELYASYLNFKIAPNIEICNAKSVGFTKKGLVLPDPFNFLDKKYFNVLNKFNEFKIQVPLKTEAPKIVNDYFKYADEVADYNKKHLPFFMTLTSSLKVYK